MKNVSTGFGLCVLGLGIATWPVLDRLMPHANAIGTAAGSALAAAATAQGDPPAPTVVWMGVTNSAQDGSIRNFFRLWSNGRMEGRAVTFGLTQWNGSCYGVDFQSLCQDSGWVEIPVPPGGNGFACRTDLNGDRSVDGVDLGIMLGAWGPSPACNADPTYACIGFGGGINP